MKWGVGELPRRTQHRVGGWLERSRALRLLLVRARLRHSGSGSFRYPAPSDYPPCGRYVTRSRGRRRRGDVSLVNLRIE